MLVGLVVRKCHFDVTACAEARRLDKKIKRRFLIPTLYGRVQLEDLSRQMHDEVGWSLNINLAILLQVSETENIRKNLAIERMIVEGCDILLDVNQVFVRQGTLIQVSLCLLHELSHGSR